GWSFSYAVPKVRTDCGEISFTSCPYAISCRARKCDPAQASITTVQLGRLPSNRIICWRVVFLRKTSRPALSCPCRWKLCLPRSMPTSVAVLMMMASENKTPCQSLALTGCGGDHLINPHPLQGCGLHVSLEGSGNLNRNRIAGVAEFAVGAHIKDVGLEAGQLGFAVMGIGADDQAMANAGLVRGGAVDRDDLRAFLAADGVGGEALAVVDVVDLDLFVFTNAGQIQPVAVDG